jgi:dihydroxy-acid dehydratase
MQPTAKKAKSEAEDTGEVAIHELRSRRYFEDADDLNKLRHNSRCKQMGFDRRDFAGKPFIAIINTWSDLLPCHAHFKTRSDDIKRGVWQSGGFPVELPAMALSETFMKPSPFLYRNMLSMQVEEQLRSQPVDGVVLMGGCDKTTPGLIMGALSMDLPMIYVPCGPMLSGKCRGGKKIGSGTDMWKVIRLLRV